MSKIGKWLDLIPNTVEGFKITEFIRLGCEGGSGQQNYKCP